MKRRVLVFLLALAAVGCGERVAPEPAEAYTVRGVYLGARFDSAAAAVDHEAIPGFMDAMRMDLRVAEPAVLRGLAEGDPIRFELVDRGEGFRIETIRPLPAGTELELAGAEEEAGE